MYDLDLLIEAADPLEIAEAIGMETKRNGKNVYCCCPSHKRVLGREDNNIGNCVLTPHGYHCFACGTSGDVFQMVQDFLGCPFPEAVKKVAIITGGSFKSFEDGKKREELPFNAEDLELIGLTTLANHKGDAGKEVIGVSRYRPTSGAYFRRGDEYISYASVKRITLNQLFETDKTLYYKLIADNARISLKKYEDLYQCFENRGCETFDKVYRLLAVNHSLDSKLVTELKNVLLLNIKRTKKILQKAEARC